ncbi:MAG: phosphatase PAP2 family protein [Terracidiphilus sp.]
MGLLQLRKSDKLDEHPSLGTGLEARRPGGARRFCELTIFDYVFVGVLLLLLFPAFSVARLPFRVDLARFTSSYWGGTAVIAVFCAIVYAIVGLPLRQTLIPFFLRYRRQKGRFVITLLLVGWMFFLLGPLLGSMVAVDALGLAELLERKQKGFEFALLDVLFPALYLFVGMVVVYAFNHALAGIRYVGTNDATATHLDWLLFHANVSSIAHWGYTHLPRWFYALLEFVYYSLYGRLLGVLILGALALNQKYAIKYVRTLMICYSIALVVFLIWPVKGPYTICPVHFTNPARWLPTYWTQEALLAKARALWAHNLTASVASVNLVDFYVGFPSMHTAMPIIALWFLRPWKRIAVPLLVVYVTLLLPSLVLLEWHFMVDMLGGLATASLAIWISELISRASATTTKAAVQEE